MAIAALLTLTLLFNRLEAGPVPSPAGHRPCVNFMLPVPATAQKTEYDVVHVNNNVDAAAFTVDLDTLSFNATDRVLRNVTVSDTFDISVQLCLPPNGIKSRTASSQPMVSALTSDTETLLSIQRNIHSSMPPSQEVTVY